MPRSPLEDRATRLKFVTGCQQSVDIQPARGESNPSIGVPTDRHISKSLLFFLLDIQQAADEDAEDPPLPWWEEPLAPPWDAWEAPDHTRTRAPAPDAGADPWAADEEEDAAEPPPAAGGSGPRRWVSHRPARAPLPLDTREATLVRGLAWDGARGAPSDPEAAFLLDQAPRLRPLPPGATTARPQSRPLAWPDPPGAAWDADNRVWDTGRVIAWRSRRAETPTRRLAANE